MLPLRTHWLRRFVVLTLVAGGTALIATAATPRSICACTIKEKSYLSTMRSDMRNLVTAQEAFFADSGRFASSPIELDSTYYLLSRGVEFESFSGSVDAFSARVRYPSATTDACWVSVGKLPDGSENLNEGEPQCDPPPPAYYPIFMARAYFALLLVAVAIRFARAGRGLPPISIGTAAGFVALLLIHPYWPHDRLDMSCYSNAEAQERGWVIMMSFICLWMAVRRGRDAVPPSINPAV